ncbi:DUF4236 domain-containing protein [Legionella impletisoli]|uniref:DUF4236 domain-containing protein n=1 Tax=Legionella impletisoli TaxID=343510 RepID=A0A917NEB3_9GAMM|nr:DUF4236 domain-containing protein [Legionella impletisoli]GGI92403.1 hypothetical protein GCM10007966_21300 [Legionella impletisoli]
MGSRFSKRITLFPGFRINFGKRGISTTVGPRGFSLGLGRQGVYGNVGLRGTGLSYRTKLMDNQGRMASQSQCKTGDNFFKLAIDDNYDLLILDEDGYTLSGTAERKVKKYNRHEIFSFLEDYAERFNQELQLSINQHRLTPKPDDSLFKVSDFTIPKPDLPRLKKKGFFSKLLRLDSYIDNKNARLQQAYDKELADWNKQWQSYLAQKKGYLEQLYQAQTGYVDAMEKTLQHLMNEIQWEKETYLSFEINNSGDELSIDIDLPEIEDIPNKEANAIERGLKLSIKEKSAKETKTDYQQCIFSILFRIAGLSFTALPTLGKVTLSGYTQRSNKSTGDIEDVYIVSAVIDRNQWQQLNFDALEDIDPVSAFQNFNLKCELKKNGDFCKIKPF